MKVAILTSRERCERCTDPAMVPEGTELIHLGQNYTDEQVLERAADAEIILVDAILPVSARVIAGLPKLKLIHSEGVGYNAIDLEAARRAGVYVCNNRAVNAGPVAEQAVLLMLSLLRRFSEGRKLVYAGRQSEAKGKFILEGLGDLSSCAVGILGFGAIGRELALRLRPFGCRLYYNSRTRADKATERDYGVTWLERDELLRRCDVVSLHAPVTPETVGMIDSAALATMKPNAILINTARGALVRDADLAEAIRGGVIYGAGLDTMDPEPVPADDPLLLLPEPWCWRVEVSPHIGGTTLAAFAASYRGFWANASRVAAGEKPVNIVNGL